MTEYEGLDCSRTSYDVVHRLEGIFGISVIIKIRGVVRNRNRIGVLPLRACAMHPSISKNDGEE
jgi:hypothetical protein